MKLVYRYINGLVLLILIIIFSTSCKSGKEIPIQPQPIIISQVDSVFIAMKSSEFQFETLVAKFSGLYSYNGSKQNFSGQMRLLKDSLIWCSINVMNIEVARVIVSKDSVKLINKLNRQYFESGFDYINNQLNTDIDFDMLQALILGNDVPYYETNKFQLVNGKDNFILSTIGRHKLKNYVKTEEDYSKVLIQSIKIDKNTLRITEQDIKQLRNPNKKVKADYSEFEDYAGLFPTLMEFNFIGVKDLFISLKFSKIEKNTDLSFPFKVPSSYTRQNP